MGTTAFNEVEESAMTRLRATVARAARANVSILLLGETGVGKEVTARSIHDSSPRARGPFIALNCGGMSASLLDSELFGHEKHAFTGAMAAKVGLIEAAQGGTLFLDEVGEMPMAMQCKLLRTLETREVRPVGGLTNRPVDVRILAATNVDIEEAVAKGTFRADLMYRLNTLTLTIPPLRARRDELPGLTEAFLDRARRDTGRETLRLSTEAMARLYSHDWPGNIRELRNVIDRAVLLCDGDEIRPQDLLLDAKRVAPDEPGRRPSHLVSLPTSAAPGAASERDRILQALDACGRNQTKAAQLLGISRRSLVAKLDRYQLPRPQKQYDAGAAPWLRRVVNASS
jgi:DNA-binding NtrC family response regulator